MMSLKGTLEEGLVQIDNKVSIKIQDSFIQVSIIQS